MIELVNIRDRRLFRLHPFDKLCGAQVWIAGGAIRASLMGEPIADYDLFFSDQDAMERTKDRITEMGLTLVFSCPQGELFTYKGSGQKVQLICKRLYASPAELIDTFDLTPAMFAYDGLRIVTTRDAIRHARNRDIHIHRLTYPVATLSRIARYQRKGYYAGNAWREFMQHTSGKVWPDEELRLYAMD